MVSHSNICNKLFRTLIISIFIFSFADISAQTYNQELFTYISPKPNSNNNSVSNNIIISVNQDLNMSSVHSNSLINVSGKIGGNISGQIIIKRRTLLFIPDNNFLNGDEITVNLSEFGVLLGDLFSENEFSFSVSANYNLLTDDVINEIYKDEIGSSNNSETLTDSLPLRYPQISIEKYDDPAEGKLFFGVFGATQYPSLLITENTGNPIFYLGTQSIPYDFKKQPNGWLTYFNSEMGIFYALNNKYELVDSFYCGNGFETDIHELLLLSNNHSYLLGRDPQIIDMSQLVEGGKEDALVLGFVIQELDEDKNVVFQWRNLDYISVLDAEEVDLTAQVIDYSHMNSICVDFDDNLIISSRNLNEITKINRHTGELIWRLGGKKNQFSFINENFRFYRQHDARRLQNGNILFFDNGYFHNPKFSRAVEYQLDETNLVATKVWEYRNNPDYFTSAMGNVIRLSNGNTLINWVRAGFVTEVKPDGSKALEIKFPPELYSYRVFKSPWSTELFEPQIDSLDFGEVTINDSQTKSVVVQSNSEKEITLTGVFNTLNELTISNDFPLTIPSFGEAIIDVMFSPLEAGAISDTLNVRSDSDSSIINSQVIVNGIGTIVSGAREDTKINSSYSIGQNYPNPFNPNTKIRFSIPQSENVVIDVYNIQGEKIESLVDQEMQAGNYKINFNGNGLASGMYFYKIIAGSFTKMKKMILLR
ncbi:aryl-sulfate sulfotransferase [Bacteroidota bacterium]